MWILSPQQLLLYIYCILFYAYLYDYICTVDAGEDEERKDENDDLHVQCCAKL